MNDGGLDRAIVARGRGPRSLFRFGPARRHPGIAAVLGLLVVLGLTVWGAQSATAWMWAQAQAWSRAARVAPGPAPQVERARRDVTGTDLGPVPRYPGLARTYWHREGRQVAVEYEGEADFAAVFGHYQAGFAALGYTRGASLATPVFERHDYTKGRERVGLRVSHKPGGRVSVRIETALR